MDGSTSGPGGAEPPVVVIGAGMGGLAAAIALAARGIAVELHEAAPAAGGKMREVAVAGRAMDAGPTVFTMRWVFDRLFERAGARLEDRVGLDPADILARHAWPGGATLDLFADGDRSEAAIAAFAGPGEAARYRAFRAEARALYDIMRPAFIAAQAAGPVGIARRLSARDSLRLMRAMPFATLWWRLGRHFRDPRLRQLFARYATYCGSSPFEAPALLSLVAEAEAAGVWTVRGGMHALARAMAALAGDLGAAIRYESPVAEILANGGRVAGVRLASGEVRPARAVVFNGDVAALGDGRLGPAAARAVPRVPPAKRSLSALVWSVVARPSGFALSRHTVFFAESYRPEFQAIFGEGRLPDDPTVYVCAQDRDAADGPAPAGCERLHMHINAAPRGDTRPLGQEEIARCTERTLTLMAEAGLDLAIEASRITTPAEFERLFPGSGGALYGRANHGPLASLARPGARSRLRGLYLAGGTAHPGPGVPMAAMSGQLAAEALAEDLGIAARAPASTRRSRPAAISGGISTG